MRASSVRATDYAIDTDGDEPGFCLGTSFNQVVREPQTR